MILIPQPLDKTLTLRWFVEYLVDNSPLFKTASAVAKASIVLGADLDKAGETVEIQESALALVRKALTSEEDALVMPELMLSGVDSEGKPTEPIKAPPRLLSRFISALLTDV